MLDPFPVQIARETSCSGWTREDDRLFWQRLRGMRGLLQVWRQALKLTHCYLREGIHPSDKDYLVTRMHLVTVCVALSLGGNLLRLLNPDMPHFFARFAVQGFCEMLDRSELIAEEHPGVFHGNEWEQIGVQSYDSSAGTAAR